MAAATLTFPSQTLLKNVVDPVDATDAATKEYVDGRTGAGTVAAAGSNTQIQYNSASTIGASAGLTFDYSSNILTITGNLVSANANLGNTAHANYFTGDGGLLSNIQAAGGAATTVSASAQPNIKSVGNLVNLQIGNSTSGPGGANGIVYFDGNGDANLAGNVIASGNITAAYFIGNGSQLTGTALDLIAGNANYANYAGNVTEAAQPNITTVGTLNYLIVSGDANVQGNLTVGGTLTYIDSTKISLVDPILELGGNKDGAPLTTNDTLDRGTLLHYYTTKTVDAFMGWKNSDGQFIFGSNVSEISGAITVNQYANVKSANFLGNIIGDHANVANLNATGNISGVNLSMTGNIAGNLTTASQPNITSLGTLTSLKVGGTTDLNTVSNVKITGGSSGQYLQTDGTGNLSWVTISSATISTGTSNVKVNSDGNITISSGGVSNVLIVSSTGVSVNGDLTDVGNGTMNTLSITGTVSSTNSTTGALKVAGGVGIAGNINGASNLKIDGTSSLNNVTINGNLVAGNANFSLPVNMTSPQDSTSTSTGALIITQGGLGVYGNINAGLDIKGTTLTGNLTTSSQPNITSLGTLTGLNVSGNIVSANANVGNLIVTKTSNLGNIGNVKITGGTSGQYLQTDGAGNLIWQDAASTNEIVAGTSNVLVNNDGKVLISSNGNSNVIVVNGNSVSVNGTLNISNLTTANMMNVSSTTDSTAYDNGALIVKGGLGVAGNVNFNKNLTVTSDIVANKLTIHNDATFQGLTQLQSIVTLTGVTDSINPSTGVLILSTGGLGVAGNINAGLDISGTTLTGTLTTHAQPNITSVGTLSSLTVTGKITGGNIYANSGTVGASLLTGTLTTAAQPNVTSLGTLTDLSVAGNISTANITVSSKANLGSNSNVIITGGTSGQYLQTDGTGNVSWKTVSTSSLINGTSNIVINPSGNINVSASGQANILQISSTELLVNSTIDSTSTTTGALVVNGGVGIAGNVNIGGILTVTGDFQVGSLGTSGPVAHTGEVTFTQTTYFSNIASSTSTTSGAVQITGGLGVQGNIYGGNIISAANTILRNGRNVPVFTSSGTMPSNPLLGDEWYDQNNDRIYQYIFDGTNYNWIDVSGGYITASATATPGTLVVRDTNGNIYGNTLVANELDVTNLVITGTTSISSMVSAGSGKSVSNTNDTIIDRFPATLYRSAKYIISARNDDGYEVLEALLIHDDSISYIQTYGDLTVGNPTSLVDVQDIVTLSSNIVSGNVCLYAQGSNSNTKVNLVSTYVTD